MIIKCFVCGRERKINPSQLNYGRGKYCSKRCEGTALNRKVSKNCLICEKEFLARPTDIKRGYGNFCSHRCANINTKKGRVAECFYCKKEFYIMPSRKRIFCSRLCRSNAQIGVSFSSKRIQNMRKGIVKALLERRGVKTPTSIEIKLYKELRKRGIRFERQLLLHEKFLVDTYVPSLNLVIEADGDYWHSLPNIIKKDKSENAYLLKCGYNLLRLTETEINNDSFKEKLPFEKGIEND